MRNQPKTKFGQYPLREQNAGEQERWLRLRARAEWRAMQIYISREQQQLGPYTVAEARSRIITGQLLGSDLAWHEGLPEWVTLSEILSKQGLPLNSPLMAP